MFALLKLVTVGTIGMFEDNNPGKRTGLQDIALAQMSIYYPSAAGTAQKRSCSAATVTLAKKTTRN